MAPGNPAPDPLVIEHPSVADGAPMWELAGAAGSLDVNSSYAYLLWCRDFSSTSVVARPSSRDGVAGFVTGYVRPDDPTVLLVWQVAVAPDHRRRGLGGAMLEAVVGVMAERGCTHMETTVTADNEASRAMFDGIAGRHGARIEESVLFAVGDFPDGHDAEHLLRIGPFPNA